MARRFTFPISGGVYKDDTPTIAEGYLTDSDNIRFNRGKIQTVGGWEALYTETFTGIARGAHTWADRNAARILAFGSQANVTAFYSGEKRDITPDKGVGTLTNPFTTLDTSANVLVYHEAHGLKGGDVVTYSLADAVGGITIDGEYTISETSDVDARTGIRDANSYFITHSAAATSTVADGGGKVEWVADLDEGRTNGIGGFGYGTNSYGSGVYGKTTAGDIDPRFWSISNWGDFGLFLPQNGALYEWHPQLEYLELVVNGDFAASDGWTEGTGWSIGSGVATASAGAASDLEQDLTGALRPGFTYDLSVTATRSAGGFQFRVTSDPGSPTDITFGETIEESGTYTRKFTAPASPTKIKFAKDASFAGTIDDVSIKVASTAYRLHDAPQYSRAMIVDSQDRVILLGTMELDGTFNAMHMRWSDIGNNRTWDPSDDNGAGGFTLRHGSAIIGGLPLRTENLIWTDVALYYMRNISSGYDIQPISGSAGLIGARACGEMDGVAFWWGTDKNFHIYRGGAPQILECTVRRDVMDNLSTNQQAKIECGINPAYSEVLWIYPDKRDGDGLECSRAVVYNWAENKWDVRTMSRTEWVKPGVSQIQ